jgi:putative endonuclease
MPDWCVYIVRCGNGNLYTGISINVERRFTQHESGKTGAKYLRGRKPLALVFQKRLGSRSLAMRVEAKIKKLSKENKEKIIEFPENIEALIKE